MPLPVAFSDVCYSNILLIRTVWQSQSTWMPYLLVRPWQNAGSSREPREDRDMSEGSLAAARRFPGRQAEIEELTARDEEFRILCNDFADAKTMLSRWEASSSPTRERLCAEYRTLIEDLAAEIEAALGSRIGGQ